MRVWWLTADGKPIASGDRATKRDAARGVVHTLHGADCVATPKREAVLELRVEGHVVASGAARCERWGSEFVFTGEGFRVEAGK